MTQIEEKRRDIDNIDAAIRDLLNQRAAAAREISRLKHSAGLPVIDEQREAEVLRHVARCNGGPISAAAIGRIYEAILEESRRIQAQMLDELSANGVAK